MIYNVENTTRERAVYDGHGHEIPFVVEVNTTTEEVTRYERDSNGFLVVFNEQLKTITERVPGVTVRLRR
ncbi:hypothetical protein [Vibrio sp. H11]|uniref:hypothetical protein n=1 Tax=Vibrio sp. H11 TaxID=2565928 RepID=UPI0010A68305|nr:hypothetical protein [Vibrio sp. H11]